MVLVEENTEERGNERVRLGGGYKCFLKSSLVVIFLWNCRVVDFEL